MILMRALSRTSTKGYKNATLKFTPGTIRDKRLLTTIGYFKCVTNRKVSSRPFLLATVKITSKTIRACIPRIVSFDLRAEKKPVSKI